MSLSRNNNNNNNNTSYSMHFIRNNVSEKIYIVGDFSMNVVVRMI